MLIREISGKDPFLTHPLISSLPRQRGETTARFNLSLFNFRAVLSFYTFVFDLYFRNPIFSTFGAINIML